MRTNRITVLATAVAAALIASSSAEARPKYLSVFKKSYPNFEKARKEVTCVICHPGKEKSERNHYAEALAKELKEPKESDEKKIAEALKAIEDKECASGKFGERLKLLKAPCVCREKKSSVIERLLEAPL